LNRTSEELVSRAGDHRIKVQLGFVNLSLEIVVAAKPETTPWAMGARWLHLRCFEVWMERQYRKRPLLWSGRVKCMGESYLDREACRPAHNCRLVLHTPLAKTMGSCFG
jgi:hypothetical protein